MIEGNWESASLFILLVICSATVSGKQCDYYTKCSCVFDDGTGMVDLSSMTGQGGFPLFMDQPATVDSYLYSYNPCGAFDEGTCTGVAVCQYDPYYYIFYEIGNSEKVDFNYDGTSLIATYTSADDTRKTYVTLVCNQQQISPSITVTGESTQTNYYMTVTAASICTVPAPEGYYSSGMSGGSVLLIIFFVLIFVYLIGGVAFTKFRHQAEGKELIPNLVFWTALPGLIKDGCVFVMGLVCRKRSVYVSM